MIPLFKSKNHVINPNTTDTLVGEGTVFEGKIKSEATIRVEGTIIGIIDCTGDVIIGEKGVVKSNISARDVIIAGQVHGDITTKGKIVIAATGQLYGNISTTSFTIYEGGMFHGLSKMDSNSTSEASALLHSTASNL